MPGPAEGDCHLFTFMFGSQCLYQVMLLNSTTCQRCPCVQPLTHPVFHRVVRGQAGLQINYEQAIEQLQGGEHMQVRQILFLQSILFKIK